MIQVGYTKKDGTDVIYKTVSGAPNANNSILELQESKLSDTSVDCFYLSMQITETEWQKYAFVDPL